MPQLDISTYTPQIFWLVIIFSIMFGVFIGVFLPKLSGIFQNRSEAKQQADYKIKSMLEATKQLQKSYDDKKEEAIRDTREYIDEKLAGIRELHYSRLQSLEGEFKQELSHLQASYNQQLNSFDESYRDIINSAVLDTLAKLGVKNER